MRPVLPCKAREFRVEDWFDVATQRIKYRFDDTGCSADRGIRIEEGPAEHVAQNSMANTNYLLQQRLGSRVGVVRTQNLLQRLMRTSTMSRTHSCRKTPLANDRSAVLINTCVGLHAIGMFEGGARATERRRHASIQDISPNTLQMNFAIDMGYAMEAQLGKLGASSSLVAPAIIADATGSAPASTSDITAMLRSSAYIDASFPGPGIQQHALEGGAAAAHSYYDELPRLLNAEFPPLPEVEQLTAEEEVAGLIPIGMALSEWCRIPLQTCPSASDTNPPEHLGWTV